MTTTAALIGEAWSLLEKLRKLMNSKEVFDIVRELEKTQKKIDSKAIQAELKVKHLEEEISQIKKSYSAEIDRLNQEHASEIANLNKKEAHNSDGDDIRVLLVLSQWSQHEESPTAEDIAGALSMSAEVTQHYLDELLKKEFVYADYNMYDYTRWRLATDGRARLFNLGKLK